MQRSPRAPAATASSPVGGGCGPTAARTPTRPPSLRGAVKPRIWPSTRHEMRASSPQEHERMSDTDTKAPGEKTLHLSSPKTLSLKRPVEHNTVRQSFSHGRTKSVVVETVKRRTGP